MSISEPKFIIEVRINEYMGRDKNPHVPFTPEEIAKDVAECQRYGATIIHYHARDPETGAPSGDIKIYQEIERRIREKCDVITMPTLGAHIAPSPEGRIAHILEMAKDPATRPDCVPIDVLSTNMAMYNRETKNFEHEDDVYLNTISTLKTLCQGVTAVDVKPAAMIWNVPSLRCAEALVEMGLFKEPVYCEMPLFSGKLLGFGHPGTLKGLHALLDFLPRNANWLWSTHCHGNSLRIAAGAIEAGGHAAIGLGDYHYPELDLPTNGQLVAYLAGMARAMGREIATVAEARQMLDMPR